MGRKPSVSRLRQILSRQDPPRFGSSYIPSTFATREEAPSKSRPAILFSTLLGRYVHTMSESETHAALLALHHPGLAELHEQKMFWRWPQLHPLTGMPGVGDYTRLPPLEGTVAVAERLGYGDIHPYVYIEDPENHGRKVRVAYPYQGDFLLFLKDQNGEIYCVNWPVKDEHDAFTAPNMDKRWRSTEKDKRHGLARFEIEKVYYLDAQIRTQPIAGEDIHKDVAANLCLIFPDTAHKITLTDKARQMVVDAFIAGMELSISPCDVMTSLIQRGLCNAEQARIVLFQSIWYREIRVDLFQPIFINQPLIPEKTDVFDFYAGWFLP